MIIKAIFVVKQLQCIGHFKFTSKLFDTDALEELVGIKEYWPNTLRDLGYLCENTK